MLDNFCYIFDGRNCWNFILWKQALCRSKSDSNFKWVTTFGFTNSRFKYSRVVAWNIPFLPMDPTDLLASFLNTLSSYSIRIVPLKVVFKWTMILKFSINSGRQLRCPSNVSSSFGDRFFASRCWCTALKTVIFHLNQYLRLSLIFLITYQSINELFLLLRNR